MSWWTFMALGSATIVVLVGVLRLAGLVFPYGDDLDEDD